MFLSRNVINEKVCDVKYVVTSQEYKLVSSFTWYNNSAAEFFGLWCIYIPENALCLETIL